MVYRMSYFKNPEQVEGNKREVITSDDNVQELLLEILKELKKMNLHLASLSDERINNTDLE